MGLFLFCFLHFSLLRYVRCHIGFKSNTAVQCVSLRLQMIKKKMSSLLGKGKWERGAVCRGVVCRSALALFFVVSNPHVKLLPALRKLPTAPPSRPAAATSGNVGGGSMGARGLDWGCTVGMLDSCGDPKLPHQLYLDNCPICYTIDCHEEIALFTQFMYT